ncbi:MAG: cysteine hydrolase [Planctomycetes bacterium]|nr:cysteine hydrolase [Planctomycetota bacterium]
MRIINGIEVLTTTNELVNPAHTAVLVIDMQNGIVHRNGPCPADTLLGQIIPRLGRLLAAAREARVLVTYAEFMHADARGASLLDGPNLFCHRNKENVMSLAEDQQEALTIAELAPQPGDLVIRKNRASAFSYTPLDAYLKARRIKSVLITGTSTRGCVLMTAVDAQMHGYYPVVLRDCVATGSPQAQEGALAWMESEMAVLNSNEVLSAWNT